MSGDSGMTMRPVLDLPDDETLERIDFVIQGLENGQFTDITKKIDFHQKLKGEDTKRFIKSLIDVIEAQAGELRNIQDRLSREQDNRMSLENRVSELETKLHDYVRNMRGVANGLIKLSVGDPLNQGTHYTNVVDTENFIDDYKNKY